MSPCLGAERSRAGCSAGDNGATAAGPASSACHPAPGSSFQHAGTRCRPPASQICSVGGNWDLSWLPSCSSAHLHEAGCHTRAARGSTRRETNLLPAHTRWGGGGSPAPASQGAQGVALAGRRRQGLSPHQSPSLLPSLPTPGLSADTASFSLLIHSCSLARAQSQTHSRDAELSTLTHPLHPLSCSSCKVSAQPAEKQQHCPSSLQESRAVQGYLCFNKISENTTIAKNKRPLSSGEKN